MSLWEKNLFILISGCKNSLQERLIIKNTLIDSLKNPNIQKDSKEASRFAFLSGSITVEAALVLPLFLFAMVNILSLFLMFESYGVQLARLHQSGRQLSVLAYAQGTDTAKQDVELVSAEYVKPLVNLMGYRGCLVVSGCVMHKWIGYDLSGTAASGREEEEMVFVAAHGEVYHESRNCSYLNPDIRTVTTQNVIFMKNRDGIAYTPCQSCQGHGELVYITDDGERYHSSIGCSGLKRTIDCVPKKSALQGGRHACSRCAV